jgi:hypothetical protein
MIPEGLDGEMSVVTDGPASNWAAGLLRGLAAGLVWAYRGRFFLCFFAAG